MLVSLRTAGRFQVGFLPGLVFIGAIGVVSFSIIVGAISFRVSGTFGEPDREFCDERLFIGRRSFLPSYFTSPSRGLSVQVEPQVIVETILSLGKVGF